MELLNNLERTSGNDQEWVSFCMLQKHVLIIMKDMTCNYDAGWSLSLKDPKNSQYCDFWKFFPVICNSDSIFHNFRIGRYA